VNGAALCVLAPQAFSPALDALAAAFSQAGGGPIQIVYGPAAGNNGTAITARLARDEVADLVILPTRLLDEQAQAGRVLNSSRTPVMRSSIGMCVRQGQDVPDIGTIAGLTRALLQARSVALSTAGSGQYVSKKLFQRLGIEAEMSPRCTYSDSESVGHVVARGGADLGFQQTCELLPVPGITFAGTLPEEVQLHTDVAAGLLVASTQRSAARRWLDYLQSPDAQALFTSAGLTPLKKSTDAPPS
jgi:molybdate transport system substrate-binding protein